MPRRQSTTINETTNELLLHILSGIDYVSGIAHETKKSIPVVYRQLDGLVRARILAKQRRGKQVAYSVNWDGLSSVIAKLLYLDAKTWQSAVSPKGNERVDAEITTLQKHLSKRMLENEKAVRSLVDGFFKSKQTAALSQEFFQEINKSKKFLANTDRLAFDKSLDLFLDAFGMLTTKERKKILSKIIENQENAQRFLAYCRLRYLQKQLIDPRRQFLRHILYEE